jgi:RimJ/RimL family protein N-acetyltransferase
MPHITFERVPFADIRAEASAHAAALPAPFDDYFETHITEAVPYRILIDGAAAGYTTVHGTSALTQFVLHDGYRKYARDAFAQARLLDSVTHAHVPASDGFFAAHALDMFQHVEKQAYFFARDDAHAPPAPTHELEFAPGDSSHEAEVRALSGDFLGDVAAILQTGKITLVRRAGALIGLGVHALHSLTPQRVSIGMFVAESARGAGIGTAIIRRQMAWAAAQNLEVTAGCWYYNHASRRTLQAAGMAAVNRWLKIAL